MNYTTLKYLKISPRQQSHLSCSIVWIYSAFSYSLSCISCSTEVGSNSTCAEFHMMRLVYIQISPMRLLLPQMLCFFYSWIFMRSCRGGDRLIWWSQAQKLHPPIVKVSNNRKPIRRHCGLKGERDKIDRFRQRMKWRLHQGPESVLSFFSFFFFFF